MKKILIFITIFALVGCASGPQKPTPPDDHEHTKIVDYQTDTKNLWCKYTHIKTIDISDQFMCAFALVF